MWDSVILIAAWLTITPPQAMWTDSTSVMVVEFNENMSIEGLLDPENYVVKDDSGRQYTVYRVGIINELDSIIIPDTSLVGLVIERIPYRTEVTTTVYNVKDKAGNYINPAYNSDWFWWNGFAPLRVQTPQVGTK